MIQLYFGTEDFLVSEFPNRKVIDEIQMAMSAFDCVIPDDSGVYCSSDITTGKRLYFEVFKKFGVHSDAELKERLGDKKYSEVKTELIKANVARGIHFTERLRKNGLTNLVNPGPFFARGFDQQHYLFLWEWVILKKISASYFNEDWEFSNGCTLEYAIASRKGIRRYDHLGNPLELKDAVLKIERAISLLKLKQIYADILERNFALIQSFQEASPDVLKFTVTSGSKKNYRRNKIIA